MVLDEEAACEPGVLCCFLYTTDTHHGVSHSLGDDPSKLALESTQQCTELISKLPAETLA